MISFFWWPLSTTATYYFIFENASEKSMINRGGDENGEMPFQHGKSKTNTIWLILNMHHQ